MFGVAERSLALARPLLGTDGTLETPIWRAKLAIAANQMRDWLEFHDSTLVDVRHVGSGVEITLSAYVHRWERIAGRWRGTGWMHPVRITVHGGARVASAPIWPRAVSTGSVTAGAMVHENVVQLPLRFAGGVELRLDLDGGPLFHVRGEQIEVVIAGSGRRIEDLPDEMRPRELG